MEHLDFILWLVLYPIGAAVEKYLSAKTRLLTGEKEYSRKVQVTTSFALLLIHLGVAIILY